MSSKMVICFGLATEPVRTFGTADPFNEAFTVWLCPIEVSDGDGGISVAIDEMASTNELTINKKVQNPILFSFKAFVYRGEQV